jgi:hypothetical protein
VQAFRRFRVLSTINTVQLTKIVWKRAHFGQVFHKLTEGSLWGYGPLYRGPGRLRTKYGEGWLPDDIQKERSSEWQEFA